MAVAVCSVPLACSPESTHSESAATVDLTQCEKIVGMSVLGSSYAVVH